MRLNGKDLDLGYEPVDQPDGERFALLFGIASGTLISVPFWVALWAVWRWLA